MDEVPIIVVGMDGSPGSRTALEYALADAGRRGARIRAVMAFDPPAYWAETYGLSAPPSLQEVSTRVETGLRSTVAEVRAGVTGAAADVPVEVLALPGAAAKVLVEQARDADDLVVGHRGRGGIASAVLGSVSLQCVLHAPRRVTVVRPDRTHTAAGAA
ncbi:universal stress protein [Pseudonocardia sp. T1-2H]|uniref:universal stress protein n=1 Tax=Pseudonocardia sp. T1-2H TaxID=3128899 RepID=UPI003101A3E2